MTFPGPDFTKLPTLNPRWRLMPTTTDSEYWEAVVVSSGPGGLTPAACLAGAANACSFSSSTTWPDAIPKCFAGGNLTGSCPGCMDLLQIT